MGNLRLIHSMREISRVAAKRVGKKKGASLHITGAACIGNTAVGMGKLVLGIMTMSFFTCASAFYTFGMVIAKCFALAGIIRGGDLQEQQKYYKLSAIVLIAASILYIIYSIRLFFRPEMSTYDKEIAIGIAAFTFTELALNIRGVIIERHNHSQLIHAIKMINLASSLICLVLTQTAILSFSSEHMDRLPKVNGFRMGFAIPSLPQAGAKKGRRSDAADRSKIR